MNNKVSVVIPSYNNAKLLPQVIESVLEQTCLPLEIIVVDDGSTDETKKVCDRYPTVQYLYQHNQGVAVARNTGMQASKGDYVLFLDSDDCLLPDAIKIGVDSMNHRPEVGFVFGRYCFYSIQADGSHYTEAHDEDQPDVASYETILATEHRIQCGCVLFRRDAIEAVIDPLVGAFDPNLVPLADVNLCLQIARHYPVFFHNYLVSKHRYVACNGLNEPAKLLMTARYTHNLQWSYIQQSGSTAYKAAYEHGKQAWTKLFSDRLFKEINQYTQTGEWIAALGALRLVLNYDPKLSSVNEGAYQDTYTNLILELRKLPIQDSLDYWKQQLAGAAPLLALPSDRPRPAEQTFQGSSQSFSIAPALTHSLKALSQQEGVTLYMTLLAAFNTLLYRYAGTEDIIVGSPFTSRISSENFVNAVPLRTNMSGNPKFQELLQRVRKVTLLAQAHQNVPYCVLVDELCPQSDLSYSPLFQVNFVFEEDVPLKQVNLSQLTASSWVLENNEGKFDLTLFLQPTDKGLEGVWSYNTDLFNADTIERMSEHFQTLLAGIVAQPQQSIAELPLLTSKEKQQLLVEWNHTQAEYPHDQCIHQLVAAQAERTPDKVAILFEGQTITYKELNQRANQLAHYLQNIGVTPDRLVGVCLERSIEMVVGLLGILKAGGAYVPIDPNFPPERVEYMLDNAQAQVLLTQQSLVKKLPPHAALTLCLDTDWEQIAQAAQSLPVSSVTPDDIAYVIYTSGSTGKPKGVQVLHCGVVNFLHSMQQQPGINSEDILLSVTTLSFDIAVLEIFLPLTVGAQVLLLSRDAAMNGKKLAKTITESGITIMQATPATWRLLLQAGWQGNQTLKMLSGGEAISRELAAKLLEHGAELWNLYGPTETTIWSTVHQVQANERKILIGKPIANTEIYILDSCLQPVPVGVAGELHIGGTGLARGYLYRPELTAEKFIAHPFQQTTARIYKTGDLARYLPDGRIECLGRLDFQVKIRGFRIELGEIESVLVQHPHVQQAVVIVREDVPGDQRLVGYIVALPEQTPNVSELRSLLKQAVPEYMVPSAFVLLEALPLTPNGKVDRKVLPAPDLSRQEATYATEKVIASSTKQEGAIATPQDDLELQLISIWEDILHTSAINTQDNFFELGGHSLLAISLIAEIEKTYHRELPLSVLLQAPTVRQLAQVLRQEGYSLSQSLVTIQKGGSKPPLFCIYGIYLYYDLAKHLDPDQPVYGVYIKEEIEVANSETRTSGHSSPQFVGVSELATRYLKEIRAHQPVGPYLLAGISLGGLVAFEMAQQLRAQGETVSFLGLLDTTIPGKDKPSLAHRLDFHAKQMLRQGIAHLAGQNSNINGINQAASEVDARVEFRDYAFNHYVPQTYPGNAVVFRARDEFHFSTLMHWHDLVTGKLEIHDVTGNHLGILRTPHVETLAKKMKVCIDQALA